MDEPDTTLSALGVLLEQHRGGMSKREAARRAGISEGRWRQVVTGQQKAGGGIVVPVNPKRETVIAMARAVGADVNAALDRAGFAPDATAHTSQRSGPVSAVTEAIESDPDLIEEARAHLLNQYDLLRRLSDPAASKERTRPSTPAAPERPLRAVARKRPPRNTG